MTVHSDIQGALVSPTYCFPHLPHNIRYTAFCVLQLVSPFSLTLAPLDNKGSAVVMDRGHNVSEVERQLNESTFYKALDHDPTHEFAMKVTDAICEMWNGDHISEKIPSV